MSTESTSVVVVQRNRVLKDESIQTQLLDSKGLFKTLSLLLASRVGLTTIPVALFLDMDYAYLERLWSEWERPLMVRMDYSRLPEPKDLGGILIDRIKSLRGICAYLTRKGCFPMISPKSDRFENINSIGVLLDDTTYKATIEAVGKGFDAGDLRLGKTIPHEIIKADFLEGAIENRHVISEATYMTERNRRSRYLSALRDYARYANETGKLLSSLDRFIRGCNTEDLSSLIPEEYQPLTASSLRRIMDICFVLRENVLAGLPKSDKYVVSLSLVPDHGWVLWDVYGSWYKR